MKTLRQWTHELMHRQFLDGLIVGFLCGAAIVTAVAVFWLQDRSIVRAAQRIEVPVRVFVDGVETRTLRLSPRQP